MNYVVWLNEKPILTFDKIEPAIEEHSRLVQEGYTDVKIEQEEV
jgi:hypothetical protein